LRPRALLALALAASGCALSAEGELPDVEVTRHGVVIPGVPIELQVAEAVVSVPVAFDPSAYIMLDPGAYHSVAVTRATFTMNATPGDLTFVRTLRMTITGATAATSGRAPLQILRYQRNDSAVAVGPVLDLPITPRAEVLPAWNDPPCVITVEVQGALPEDSWTADVTIHLSVTVGL
jgi:hypothetical protein